MLHLYDQCRTGDGELVASLLPLDPPAHAYQGVVFYASALRRARAEAMRRAEEKRKQKARAGGHPLPR